MLELDDFIKSFRREADEEAARRIPAVLDELEGAALRDESRQLESPPSGESSGQAGDPWGETVSERGGGSDFTGCSGQSSRGDQAHAESARSELGSEAEAPYQDGFHDHPRIRELIEQYEYAVDALNKDRTTLQEEVKRVVAVEEERERAIENERREKRALELEVERLKAQLSGPVAAHSEATSESQSSVRHLSREDLERLAKVDAQTEELRGEFQILRKILDVGQSVVEDFSEEKDSDVASLRRDIEEMRQEARVIQTKIGEGFPNEEHKKVMLENETLRRDLHALQVEHQSTKRKFLLEQRERLERLEVDAELTRGESEENAYKVANLEQEKEGLKSSLAEVHRKLKEAREEASRAAEASTRLQQARENTFKAQMETNQKCVENLEELLERERREAAEAKERLERSGAVQLELESVNRKLVEGAVRTSDIEKSMQVKINEAVAKFQKQCKDNEAVLSKVEEQKQQLRVAKSQVENLREEKKVFVEELKAAQEAISHALDARDRALQQTVAQNEAMQFQKEEFAAELSALKGDIWALRSKHESAMQLFDSTRIEMDQAKNDVETFCSEYASTRDTLVSGALERVNTVRTEMRAVFQVSQKEIEALRLSADVMKSKMEDEIAQKAAQFEDFKYKSHMSVLKMEGTLEKLTSEKEELQAKIEQQLLEFEGEKSQVEDTFKRQLELKQEENKILMKKREHNAQEHATLMQELKAKFQEVMDLKTEFDQRRRKMEQENSDLERQLFLVTKDREETLSKFRIERNAWSEKLREAKLKTAKEEAQLRSRVTELESEKTALTNRTNLLQIQVTKLEVEVSKDEEKRLYALGQAEMPRSNEVPRPLGESKSREGGGARIIEKENHRPVHGQVAWAAREHPADVSDQQAQGSRHVLDTSTHSQGPEDPGSNTVANQKWATRTRNAPPDDLVAAPVAPAVPSLGSHGGAQQLYQQYPATIVAPRSAAGIVAAAQNPMAIPGFAPRMNVHAQTPYGGYSGYRGVPQQQPQRPLAFPNGRGSDAAYTFEYLGNHRPRNLPVAQSSQPGVTPYDAHINTGRQR